MEGTRSALFRAACAPDEREVCASTQSRHAPHSHASKTSTVHLYDRSSSLWTRLAGVGADDRIQAKAALGMSTGRWRPTAATPAVVAPGEAPPPQLDGH